MFNTYFKKFIKNFSSYLKIYFLLVVMVLVLGFRLLLYDFPLDVDKNFYTTVVVNEPVVVENSYIVINTSSYRVITRNLDYYVSSGKPLQLGDKLGVSGSRYYSTVYAKEISYLGSSIIRPLLLLKSYYLTASLKILTEPYASLLNGMLFGTNPVISEGFKDKLIQAGVIHIIVVSGYNITILFVFAYKVFFKLSAKPKVFIGSILVILYVCAVGFEPPVTRALIMGLLVGFSKAFGAVKSTTYILLISSLLLLIVSPSNIVSVSFQLTFAASLGLIICGNPFFKMLENTLPGFNKLPFIVKESFSSSTVAQIFVLPIISYYFGRVSLLGFIVNPLVLWVVPIIMLLGFISTTLVVLGFYALIPALSLILSPPFIYFVDIVQLMSQLPGGNIPLSINWVVLIIYYTLLTAFTFYITSKYRILPNEI